MEEELKAEFRNLHSKIDGYMKHQSEICNLKHEPLDEHLKESPPFRDKIVKISESLRINWVLLLMVIGGCVSGFWFLIRVK